ncbi:hypothetical protein ACHAP3_000729 [Botrytis cinerea]
MEGPVNISTTRRSAMDAKSCRPPSKKYVQALVSRIDSLEKELASYRQARPHGEAGSSQASQLLNVQNFPLSGNKSDPVDDLGDSIGRLSVNDDGNITYFGPRSNFLSPGQEIRRARMRSAEPLQVQPRTDMNLSLEIQEHLLEYFWVWQNPWNYLIHKKRFLEEYQLPGGKYCSDLLLTAVLALAARYSDNPEVRTDPLDSSTAGKYQADKAKAIISNEMESPAVSTIVATCLISMWEMAVDEDSLGWIYIGMASRMAFNLGLHLDCSDLVQSGKISLEDAEIRNITWWGLYMLEKLFNIGLGRPSTIPERDIITPLPYLIPDVEYGAWSPLSSQDDPGSAPTQISFAISSAQHTCKIFRITSETMDIIYVLQRASKFAPLVFVDNKTTSGSYLSYARRVAISAVHAIGTSALTHLFDATTPDSLLRRKAARLLCFNFSCLQEMSVAFVWSKRTMRTLQLIAKHWSVDELLKEKTNILQAPETKDDRQAPSNAETDEALPSPVDVSVPGGLEEDSMLANMDWMLSYDLGEGGEDELVDLDFSLWEFNQNFA